MIPLVPGYALYSTMSCLVRADYSGCAAYALTALSAALGIAGGIVAGSVLFLGELFTLSDLSSPDLLVLVVVALLCKPVFDEFNLLLDMGRNALRRLRNWGGRRGEALPAGAPTAALTAPEERDKQSGD